MISDSDELCETEVCFLHIQLIGTYVWLPKTHNVPPEVNFESSTSPAKSESWNSPSLHCLAVLPTWHYCLYSHVWWTYEINRFRRLSQASVHFVIDRASLFTDRRISGRPILAKYKHFRTIWERAFDNFPSDFNSFSLKCWSSMHGVDTLWSCWVVLFANSQYRSTHFLARPSISLGAWRNTKIFRAWQFFSSPFGNSWFKHGSVIVNNISAYFTLSLSASQVFVIKERCWFSQINFFIEYFPHRIIHCFVSFQLIWCHPHTQIRIIFFSRSTNKHSQLEIFSQPCFNRIFSSCLSHNSPAKGWPYRFRSRGTTGSSILDHDLRHLCRGRRIQMSGHSDLGMFNIFGASFIFTWF